MALLVLLSGCSSVSSIHDSCADPGDEHTVVSYRLPEPYLQVDLYRENQGDKDPLYHVRVTSVAVPGTNLYHLILEHSASTRDQLHVSVTPAGLLERMTYDRQPRGADAVVALGRAALKAASMFAGVPLKGDGAAPEFAHLVARRVLRVEEVRDKWTPILATPNSEFHLCARFESADQQPAADVKGTTPAFYYRPLRPLKVDVAQVNAFRQELLRIEGILYVPDVTAVRQFSIPSGTLAKQSYDFVFTDGTLSQVAVRKESGLLTIAEVPGQILGTVTGLPAQLLNVEVNHHYPNGDPRLETDDDKGSGSTRPRQIKE